MSDVRDIELQIPLANGNSLDRERNNQNESRERNDRTCYDGIRQYSCQCVERNVKTIMGAFMGLLVLTVIVLAGFLIHCGKTQVPVPIVYPISTTMSAESLTNYFHQEIHYEILSNAMVLICEKTDGHINDSICLNIPVFDTNSDKMIKMKVMKHVPHSSEMNVRYFHPFGYVPLSIGEYLVQFNMSIYRHVKYSNETSEYGVTMKLDEKTLVSCLYGRLGNLSVHETDPCSFLPLPVQKYSVDLDEKYTFVRSKISFNLDFSVKDDEAKLHLTFGQEGFVDDTTLIIAKKS